MVLTRDEGGFYARLFARRGIAGLAYDKCGSGASGGDLNAATYEDLAGDAVAAVRFLAERREIDGGRIGLRGVSEGGWFVPIAAAGNDSVAFVSVVSATAGSPAEQVRHEVGERVKRAGFGADIAARATDLCAGVSAFERTGEGYEELDRALREAARREWFAAARYLPEGLITFDKLQKLGWYPSWRARMDFDAPAFWRRVRCPVLVLLGGRDPKIDGDRASIRIHEALAEGGNSDVTVKIFPRAGHGLVEWWLPVRLPPPRFPHGYLP